MHILKQTTTILKHIFHEILNLIFPKSYFLLSTTENLIHYKIIIEIISLITLMVYMFFSFWSSWLQRVRSMTSNNTTECVILVMDLLKELHDTNMANIALKSDASKSATNSQGQELFFAPLFPWVLNHHYCIHEVFAFLGSTCPWPHWNNCIHNNDLPILWDSLVAIPQYLQAFFITPIMKNPLQNFFDIN